MFGSRKQKLRHDYDDRLLESIEIAKQDWDQAKETQAAIADVDTQIISQTALARQKYFFLYREARRRQVRGKHIQESVFDY